MPNDSVSAYLFQNVFFRLIKRIPATPLFSIHGTTAQRESFSTRMKNLHLAARDALRSGKVQNTEQVNVKPIKSYDEGGFKGKDHSDKDVYALPYQSAGLRPQVFGIQRALQICLLLQRLRSSILYSFASKTAATSTRRSRIFRCCGHTRSHFPHFSSQKLCRLSLYVRCNKSHCSNPCTAFWHSCRKTVRESVYF